MLIAGWSIGMIVITTSQLIFNYPLKLPVPGQPCIDFQWMYLASQFSLSGHLTQAYNHQIFSNFSGHFTNGCVMAHVDYPPTLFLYAAPFGLFSYWIGKLMWVAITLSFFLFMLWKIIPGVRTIIAAFSLDPVFANVTLGHNGFLTAGLFACLLLTVENRQWLAGIFIGLLSYKPQFGILIPVALVASGNWRALASAAISATAFAVIAGMAFGFDSWIAFAHALTDRAAVLADATSGTTWLCSIFSLLRDVGISARLAFAAQAIAILSAATVVWRLWSRPFPHALKAAGLCVGAVIASPHAYPYDLTILLVAAAFFIRDGLTDVEKKFLFALWACGVPMFLIGQVGGWVILVIYMGMMALVLCRGVRLTLPVFGNLTPTKI
ncbi:MAG TPA: glycosyltransferase family 87 protein [Stellaceae bacterium]|nr:glycosyltransferase family 87 protein [Stellaceae bacterium]